MSKNYNDYRFLSCTFHGIFWHDKAKNIVGCINVKTRDMTKFLKFQTTQNVFLALVMLNPSVVLEIL